MVPIWLSNVLMKLEKMEPPINALDDSQLTTNQLTTTLKGLNTLVPQYPIYTETYSFWTKKCFWKVPYKHGLLRCVHWSTKKYVRSKKNLKANIDERSWMQWVFNKNLFRHIIIRKLTTRSISNNQTLLKLPNKCYQRGLLQEAEIQFNMKR